MRGHDSESSGFSLVEVVIAMFLLGIIAIALLPALWQGIMFSSQQSATATATRHLYALVEEAREGRPTCATLAGITATDTIPDGRGADITISGTYDSSTCDEGVAVPITLTATDSAGTQLARMEARVFIP